MAVAFRSFTRDSSAAATSVAPAKPTGLADGDVLIAFLSTDSTPTLGAPGDWTAAHAEVGGTTKRARTWYRVVADAASEPATYTFTSTTSVPITCIVVAYSGVDNTTPMDAAAVPSDNASSTNVTALSITTVTDNAVVVWAGNIDSSTFTCTQPGSTTLRHQATTNRRQTVADFVQATAGATGNVLGTISTARESVGVHVALRPASSGTPGTLTVTAATAPAAGDTVGLTGQGALPVAVASASAAGEAVTFAAASTLIVTSAESPAAGGAVTFASSSLLTVSSAEALSAADSVGLTGHGILGVVIAPAPAAAGDVDLHGPAGASDTLTVTSADATADGGTVNLTGAVAASLTVSVAPADSAADSVLTGQGVLTVVSASAAADAMLNAAAVFAAGTAEAAGAAEAVTLDATHHPADQAKATLIERPPLMVMATRDRPALVATLMIERSRLIAAWLIARPDIGRVVVIERPAMIAGTLLERKRRG